MKELDDVFQNKTKKKASVLTESLKTKKVKERAMPRKVHFEDYEAIRLFAFKNRITMLEATEELFNKAKNEIENSKTNFYNKVSDVKYSLDSNDLKNVRMSNEFIKFLKELSVKTDVPSLNILSYFVSEHLK